MLTGNSGTKQSGSKRGKNATEDVNDRFMSRARFTTEVESRHIGWVMAACAAMIVKWFHRRPFVDQWNAGIISGGGVPPLSHPPPPPPVRHFVPSPRGPDCGPCHQQIFKFCSNRVSGDGNQWKRPCPDKHLLVTRTTPAGNKSEMKVKVTAFLISI